MSSQADTTGRAHMTWLRGKLACLVEQHEYVSLAVLILIVSLISVTWNIQDTRPMAVIDAHVYLRKTFHFVNTTERQGITRVWETVSDVSWLGRPPLYQILTVPLIWLLGRSMDAALTINIVFQALLLVCTYGMGRLVKNGRVGLLAALLVATYPPVVNFSRFYMPHYAVAACVALSLWLLLLLLKTRSLKIAWLFGASLGFGALICHYFAFHLPVPTVMFGLYMVLFQTRPRRPASLGKAPGWLLGKLRDPFVLRGLLPGALIAVGLIAPWYLTKGLELLPILERVVAREEVFVRAFPEVAPSFWWYALTAPGAISNFFAVLLIIGLAVGIIKRRLSTGVLVVAVLATYSLLSTRTSRAWAQFVPALPGAAVLTAAWVVDIGDLTRRTDTARSRTVQVTKLQRRKGQITVTEDDGQALTLDLPAAQRRIRKLFCASLIAACVGVAAFNFAVVTWGAQPWSRPMALALGAPLDSETCSERFNRVFCPNPALNEDWRLREVLQIILDDRRCESGKCHLTVVSERNEFEAEAFRYHLAQDFPQARIGVSGPGRTPLPQSFGLLLRNDYIVRTTVRERHVWVGARQVLRILEFLESPPAIFADAHQTVATFPLPPGHTAELIKRTKPLTYEEARLSIEAVDLPEGQKSRLLAEIDDLSISH